MTLHLRLKVTVSPNICVPLDRGNECTTTLPLEVFSLKKLCSTLHSIEVDFHSKKGKVRFLSHPLGDLTYALHLQLVGKPVYDFLFVIIELFSQALTVETLQEEICRRERFLKGGVGHFDCPF